jgi:hypothetical protein
VVTPERMNRGHPWKLLAGKEKKIRETTNG